MYKSFPLTLIALSVISLFAQANELEQLDVVEVITKGISEKDKVFIKANANSTRENIAQSTQQLDAIVRSVPGAFTQMDKSQGTVSINIRGGTGFGRANTMIDGVPQTFYASSADAGGRAGGTSQFGTMIDPSFLSLVDVERGTFSGKNGANALMGSANFKTIGVDDLIESGKNVGGMTKMLFGTNGIGPNYMGAVAGKVSFENDRSLGAMYGYSWRKISQDYKVGGGRRVTESSIDLNDTRYISDEDDRANTDTSPYRAGILAQKPTSNLAKLEYKDRYQTLTLGYRDYNAALAGRKIKNRNHQLNYHLTIPESRWLDLNVLYAKTQGIQQYDKGVKIVGKTLKDSLRTLNNTVQWDVNNTFHFPFLFGSDLDMTVGYSRLNVEYSKNRHPSEININLDEDETNDDPDCTGLSCVRKSLYTSTFQADGKQTINSLYFDNSLTFGIFAIDGSVNMTKGRYQGYSFRYLPHYVQDLQEQEQKAWNQAYQTKDFTQVNQLSAQLEDLYEQYCDGSYDANDCKEINIPIAHKGSKKKLNYSVAFSANVHDLFTPFVSYAKTHRLPNINEMFFSSLGHYGVNTALRPEQARTWQIGFNGFKEGIFTENDRLGFKVLTYKTKVNDYIFNVQREAIPSQYIYFTHIYHRNRADKVKMNGIELELNYDMGRFFANFAYAQQKTTQPVSFTDASSRVDTGADYARVEQGFGLSKVSMLPEKYASLEIGTRWFNEKLVIGGTGKYFGKSKRASTMKKLRISDTEFVRLSDEIPKQPIIFDFYVSYEPIKNLILKAEIQNVFDKKYIDPLDSNNDSASQTIYNINYADKEISVLNNFARGRTYVASVSYKF